MDYDRYLNHFKSFSNSGRLEAHLAFETKPSDKNPDFQSHLSGSIEASIQGYVDEPSPGIKYRRDGHKFYVDLVVYKAAGEGHLDYFDRAMTEVYDIHKTLLLPIERQLAKGLTPQTPVARKRNRRK